jgi:hypothetical protein
MQISLLEKIREVGSSFTFTEEDLFDQVAGEVANNSRKDGLWTKALSESSMNEDRAKALYIKLRVDQLHVEVLDLLRKLRNEEQANLIYLLEEAKKDRLIAAEELSKVNQFKIESDEQKTQNEKILQLKNEELNSLRQKIRDTEFTIRDLKNRNKKLHEELSASSSSVFNLSAIIVIASIAAIIYFTNSSSSKNIDQSQSNENSTATKSSNTVQKK